MYKRQELEDVVAKMRTIVRMAKPYKEIPKLPELREKFMNCYMRILEEQAEPDVYKRQVL